MILTGAQILMKCLEREGVKHIFGYPGGVVLDIYEELARTPNIRHILVRHEQAAVQHDSTPSSSIHSCGWTGP